MDRPEFRQALIASAVGHVVLAILLIWIPGRSMSFPDEAPIFVDVLQSRAPAAKASAPAAKAAPKPKQVVDEAVVIPKQPKPLPKPKPEAKVEPKPEPAKKPKPAALTPEQLIAKIREKRGAEAETAGTQAAGSTGTAQAGRFDPLMAAYVKRLMVLLYNNWTTTAFSMSSTFPTFEVELSASGKVQSARKVRSSGNRHMDESAERAIWKTDPFPPPPRGLRKLQIVFDPKAGA